MKMFVTWIFNLHTMSLVKEKPTATHRVVAAETLNWTSGDPSTVIHDAVYFPIDMEPSHWAFEKDMAEIMVRKWRI